MLLLALSSIAARAEIDPKCVGLPKPDDYSEQVQQDFLQNYFALATTLSPIHGPVPHEAGKGAIGVDLLVLPPLGCKHRYVLEWTKTEDTTVTPLAPRPRVTFALDGPKEIVVYGGFAYVPPVPLAGTRNVIVGGEIGAGVKKDKLAVGGRVHAQLHKTVADIATAFSPDEPAVPDLFVASTFGFDAMIGYEAGAVTPYLALGVTDASTFFLVGDDLFVSNNYHPYAGPVASLGADALVKERIRVAGELYAAPGGVWGLPDPDEFPMDRAASKYGSLYTARLRVGYEL